MAKKGRINISQVTGDIIIKAISVNINDIIALNDINDMYITKGETFNINYSTNITAIKHEFSWDGGVTYWDKTSEVTSSGTNYTYSHNAETSYDSFNMAIRVTDANGNTSVKTFTITFNSAEEIV